MTTLQKNIYDSLCRESKKCIVRSHWRWGRAYLYRPRSHLLQRLEKQFNLTKEQAYTELIEIRRFVLAYPKYY